LHPGTQVEEIQKHVQKVPAVII